MSRRTRGPPAAKPPQQVEQSFLGPLVFAGHLPREAPELTSEPRLCNSENSSANGCGLLILLLNYE